MKRLRRSRRLIVAAIAIIGGAGAIMGQTVVIRHAALSQVIVTIYPTSSSGDWTTAPLHEKVDDASNVDYISCTQGLGASDECELSFGTGFSDLAGFTITAATINWSDYAAAPSTTGLQLQLFKNVDVLPILQADSPTIALNTFVSQSRDLDAAELALLNAATTIKIKLTVTDFGATNRCGFVSMTITYQP